MCYDRFIIILSCLPYMHCYDGRDKAMFRMWGHILAAEMRSEGGGAAKGQTANVNQFTEFDFWLLLGERTVLYRMRIHTHT